MIEAVGSGYMPCFPVLISPSSMFTLPSSSSSSESKRESVREGTVLASTALFTRCSAMSSSRSREKKKRTYHFGSHWGSASFQT